MLDSASPATSRWAKLSSAHIICLTSAISTNNHFSLQNQQQYNPHRVCLTLSVWVDVQDQFCCPHVVHVVPGQYLHQHLLPLHICQIISTIANVTIYLPMSGSPRLTIWETTNWINHTSTIYTFLPQNRPKCMLVSPSDHTGATSCWFPVLSDSCVWDLPGNQENQADFWPQPGGAHLQCPPRCPPASS